MKVFITGGTGLLGSSLKEVFDKEGISVYDQFVDIRNTEELEKEIKNYSPDFIVHTAAVTNINQCELEREMCQEVNVLGTKNLREIAKELNIPIIFISTVSVFDGERGNYKEDEEVVPTNFYNKTKIEGEKMILSYEKGQVLRINLIGVHKIDIGSENFFEWALNSIKSNKDMNLFKDVFINPLSNWTISEIILKIIKENIYFDILHIGSKDCLSKAEIVKMIINIFDQYKGNIKEISIDELDGPKRQKEMWLNIEKAENILNIKMPTIKEEIEKILNRA